MKRYVPFYPLLVFLRQAMFMGGVSLRRIPLFLIYFFRFILMEPLRLVEVLLFEQLIRKHVLKEDPIFILGHWRSGTSHLQNLLHQDANFSTMTLYRMLFSDHFIWTESWLNPLLCRLSKTFGMRYSFQRTTFDFNTSGEFDTALCSIGSTHAYTWAHFFPQRYHIWMQEQVFNDGGNLNLSDYDYLIRKLSFKENNKRIIVKSPGDTARIQALLQMYPNASFIYLCRDSYEVYNSTIYLWEVIQTENSLQHLTKEAVSELILRTYSQVIKNYEQGKYFIPKGRLFEVSFEELHENSENVLRSAYQQLSLGEFHPEYFKEFLSQNKAHQKAPYPKDIQLEQQLKSRWRKYYREAD